jgi:predicted ATP-grasp superfamily ATP-dependent carboligase
MVGCTILMTQKGITYIIMININSVTSLYGLVKCTCADLAGTLTCNDMSMYDHSTWREYKSIQPPCNYTIGHTTTVKISSL